MEAKFTKGEWKQSSSRNHHVVHARFGDVSTFLCEMDYCPDGEANAHLIAAAPNGFELGELVIKMCDHREGLSPTEVGILYDAATVFIKKARGDK